MKWRIASGLAGSQQVEGRAAGSARANKGEIEAVGEEWQGLREQFAGRPLNELQAALARLGSAWQPASEEELQGGHEILTRGKA